MVSFKTTFLALTSVLSVAADYWIDPESVDIGLRNAWCQSEISTCPIICAQTSTGGYKVNTCDPKTLQYGCVCSDGKQPNVSEYSLTLPYFVCQQWGTQCVKGCGSNSECAASCQQDHPCGAQNPTRVNSTTSATVVASSTAAAATSNQVFDGVAGSSGSSGNSNNGGSGGGNTNAAPASDLRAAYGLAMVSGGLLAGFFMML